MLRLLLPLLLLISISTKVFSQENAENKIKVQRPNNIKINTLALPAKNISLLYERAIMPKLSAQIGFGYKYTGVAPKIIIGDNATIGVDMEKITGSSATFDLHYYIKPCDPTLLEGFYVGAYFKYARYKTNIDFSYTSTADVISNYESDASMREFGVGIKLGYQILIKKRFSVDFLFFGPRFSRYKFQYELNDTPPDAFFDDLSEYVNDVIDRFGGNYKVNIERKGDGKANAKFSFVNMRFGLALGYTF